MNHALILIGWHALFFATAMLVALVLMLLGTFGETADMNVRGRVQRRYVRRVANTAPTKPVVSTDPKPRPVMQLPVLQTALKSSR